MQKQVARATPLSSYQILMIFIFVLMLFTIVVDYMALPALSAVLLPELKITTSQFGIVVSAYSFSAGISAFLATGFLDKFDRKKSLLLYYGGFLLGMILCLSSGSFTSLVLARIVSGSFGGVVAANCYAIVSDLFESNQRGRVLGYIQLAFALGLVVGLPTAMYLSTAFNWQLIYWIIFLFGSILFLLVLLKVKPLNKHLNNDLKDNKLLKSFDIAKNINYWKVFANNIFLVLADTMFMTFGSAYSTNNLGVSLEDLPILYGLGGIATIVLSPFIGHLSDKLGKLKIFIFGTIIAITSIAFYSNLGSSPLWLVVSIHTLIFIGINARMISSGAIATMVPIKKERGSFMALDSSFQQLAGGVAATSAGLIVYQSTDGQIVGYSTLGFIVIGIMIITTFLMYSVHLHTKNSYTQ